MRREIITSNGKLISDGFALIEQIGNIGRLEDSQTLKNWHKLIYSTRMLKPLQEMNYNRNSVGGVWEIRSAILVRQSMPLKFGPMTPAAVCPQISKRRGAMPLQAIVAMVAEEPLVKTSRESAGISDEKSIDTWNSDDVLALQRLGLLVDQYKIALASALIDCDLKAI